MVGELARCHVAPSGHVYFDLKDREGLIACVCFKSTADRLDARMPLPDGTAVEVVGQLTAYKEKSQYQLIVRDLMPTGRGELYRRFELLKEALRREGLFDDARKRPIPSFIRDVAVVTSKGAAAFADFVTTCRRRGAHVRITLVHAPVQGDAAPRQLARAIRHAGRLAVDVVVVARGGGSIEDLWAFNTEIVARAIAACAKPVISAVGHETDFTIADFVCDLRAATPTAAAELVARERAGLLSRIESSERRLGRALARTAQALRALIERLSDNVQATSDAIVAELAQRLDSLMARLAALGPQQTLNRGYAVVYGADRRIVRDSATSALGEQLDIQLMRGRLAATVTGKEDPHEQGQAEE